MPRSLWRRASAAALPAVLAAAALPAVADAASVGMVNTGAGDLVGYAADFGEVNNVRVGLTSAGIVISDQVPIRTRDNRCRINSSGDAVCPANAVSIVVQTLDRNDRIQYTAPHRGAVLAGDGADLIFGGMRQAGFGRPIEPVEYRGNDSRTDTAADTVSYAFADRGVVVDLGDAGVTPLAFNDGRPGIDREHIFSDIEVIEGSNFSDPQLFGSDRNETFRGLRGDDVIGTGGGDDLIDESDGPNGADTLNGGNGANDRILYTGRSSGVNVSLDGVRNDGAPGENDDVRQSVEHVNGTDFGDTLIGNSLANSLIGFGGNDTIAGRGGNDDIAGYSGVDTLLGEGGNDSIFARDGERDTVSCGSETDTAHLDAFERHTECENRPNVGKLRLAPDAIQAQAGKLANVQVSWRHPRAWRKIRSLKLSLQHNERKVGEITTRPSAREIVASGAVELARKRTRITPKGKTVTARLALRIDESLAGQTLTADVTATDARGARQVERGAATIRVKP